jgi:ABC-type phosphate transport system substrate-binding protein
LVVGALATGACSFLLDRSATQCHSDADCTRVSSQLTCQAGVCATASDPPTEGPPGCFSGTPSKLTDFLNQCTSADYNQSFDDCARLGLCGADASAPALVAPPPATAAASPPTTAPIGMCEDPSRPKIVYINGSSNFIPLLAKLAPLLAATGVTPVFQQTNSCAAVKSMYGAANLRYMKDPTGTTGNYAQFYPTDGSSPQPCLLGSAAGGNGVLTDIGESEIFASSCNMAPTPAVQEFTGPIETMVFAVPIGSSETTITAAAAREVFGLGSSDGNKAAPWTDPAYFYVRNVNTATQQMFAHAIGVSADMFWGIDEGSAQNVQGALGLVTQDKWNNAIGIIGTDFYEGDSRNLKALAFEATGQTAAYWPDSTTKARDKRNVRDGHYPVWGPLHFFTGVPYSANAGAFLTALVVPSLNKDVLDAYIQESFVPPCAMAVSRDSEAEDIKSYTPPVTCRCYFESAVPGGVVPSDCVPCPASGICPGTLNCNVGFCE